MLTIIVASCADENLKPIVTFDDAGHGAYIKLIVQDGSVDIDFFTQSGNTDSYMMSVEFIDDEKGALVANYAIDVEYKSGGASQTIANFRSFDAASFTTSDDGNKAVLNISIPHQELIDAVGGTVLQADQFIVKGILNMTDGSIHTADNSSASVKGAAFVGHFNVTFSVVCPSDLAGTHTYTTVGWCGTTLGGTGTSTWVSEGTGLYSVVDGAYDFGAYDACYGDNIPGNYPVAGLPMGNLRINDLCNGMFWTGASQ